MAEASQPAEGDVVEAEQLVKDRGKDERRVDSEVPSTSEERATTSSETKKSKNFWSFKFPKKNFTSRLKKSKKHGLPEPKPAATSGDIVCTGYRRTEDHGAGSVLLPQEGESETEESYHGRQECIGAMAAISNSAGRIRVQTLMTPIPAPPTAVSTDSEASSASPAHSRAESLEFDPVEWQFEQRRRELERGVEISPSQLCSPSGYPHFPSVAALGGAANSLASLASSFQHQCVVTPAFIIREGATLSGGGLPPSAGLLSGRVLPSSCHTQVDYIHCLVPDLREITNCSFYWGVMDRYEAERLLENRPEGTFLLRDSAQEEFLFSVSFRRYGRSLHARIEQWNHKFSFDSHDPGVYAASTVCGLIEHYKDPSCCMFFEPMLTLPLIRTSTFNLQHLCRSVICSSCTYDGVNLLPLPPPMIDYLKIYHYKQKVRVRRFDTLH